MKNLVIFVNGNRLVALVSPEMAIKIGDDIKLGGTTGRIEFVTELGALVSLSASSVDGFYVSDYVAPPPSKEDEFRKKIVSILEKESNDGDEWRDGK